MRYLSVDYGLKRVGLAICDPSETIVSPLKLLSNGKNQTGHLIEQIKEIISVYRVDAVVMGLPLNMDGTEGRQAKLTINFVTQLQKQCPCPVYLQDERLSSSAADEILEQSGLSRKKRMQKRDMLAACDILNDFLNKNLNSADSAEQDM